MYAVIKTGGKQYRVQPGDVLVVEKLDGEPGSSVAFGEVLMLGEGDAITLGAPTIAGATVSATLIETRKGEKVKIFKKKRRQGYRRTLGHRQTESVLRVTAIAGEGKEAKWDGEVSLTTKAELNARSRGLVFQAPAAAGEAAPAKAAKAAPAAKKSAAPKAQKVVDTLKAEEVVADPAVQEAMASAEVNAPVETEAKAKPAAKAKAAPKAEAKTEEAPAAEAKKPAAKKAAAPKAEGGTEKKPAAKKAAPKKDKGAE